MKAVLEFANNVLEYGRDRYREKPTPLFADGINVFTGLGNGLGDLGEQPGMKLNVDLQTKCHDPRALFSVLDLYEATKNEAYLPNLMQLSLWH